MTPSAGSAPAGPTASSTDSSKTAVPAADSGLATALEMSRELADVAALAAARARAPPPRPLRRRQLAAMRAANAADTPRMGSSAMRYAPRVLRDFESHLGAAVRGPELGADLNLETILAYALDAPGELLALAGAGRLAVVRVGAFGPAGLLVEPSAALVSSARAPVSASAAVALSANGRTAAAMEGEGGAAEAVVLDVRSGHAYTLRAPDGAPHEALALSANGRLIAFTGRARLALVFKVGARGGGGGVGGGGGGGGAPLYAFGLQQHVFAAGTCVCFSPDGLELAVGGDMRRCTVWDLAPAASRAAGKSTRLHKLHWDDTGGFVAVLVSLPVARRHPKLHELHERTLGLAERAAGAVDDALSDALRMRRAQSSESGGGGAAAAAAALANDDADGDDGDEGGGAAAVDADVDVADVDPDAQRRRVRSRAAGAGNARARAAGARVRAWLGLPPSALDEISKAAAAGAPPPLANDAHRSHAVHVVAAAGGSRLCTARARADPAAPTAVSLRVPLRRALAGTAAAELAWGHRAFTMGDASVALDPVFGAIGAGRLNAAVHSHDGRLVAAGGNGALLIIDAQRREALLRVRTRGWVMGVAWSRDDRLLAVGAHDKSVRVLDVNSGVQLLEVGQPREYWPTHLAFSGLAAQLADGNRDVAVHSCDGSRLPLRKHVDATALLHFETPRWEATDVETVAGGPPDGVDGVDGADPGTSVPASASADAADTDPSRLKFVRLLVSLVARNPLFAFNPLPSDEEMAASEGLRKLYAGVRTQPLGDDGCRLLEMLVFRQERPEVKGLVTALPALALLPSSAQHATPAFEVAIMRRDVRLLRILLAASCRAPVAMRQGVLSDLVPRIVRERLGAAVALFLDSDDAALELSGATTRAACHADGSPLDDDATAELHETWGGEGTRIWAHLDPKNQRRRRDGSEHVGVEVRPLRAPLPALCRRETLEALLRVPQRRAFRSAILRPYVDALWVRIFAAKHRRKTARTFVHFGACLVYAALLAAGVRSPWLGAPPAAAAGGGGDVESVALAALGGALLVFGVQLLGAEALQFYDEGGNATLGDMAAQYAADPYNFADVLQALVSLYAVASEYYPPLVGQPPTCAGVRLEEGGACRATWTQVGLVWTLALQFVRLMQELRGYDYTGWLVEALTANLVDFLPFLFLVFLLVTTFGFIFLLLFTPAIDRARSEAAALLAAADSPTLAAVVETGASFAPDETGFGDVLQAWLSSYAIGMFADFNLEVFTPRNTVSQPLSSFFLVVYLLLLGVVVLNALIALLGDSYSRVQDNQLETRLRLRAKLMVEYLNVMGAQRRDALERQTMWLHVLHVVNDVTEPEWGGQLSAYKSEVRKLERYTEARLEAVQRRIVSDIDLLGEKMDALAKSVAQLAKRGGEEEGEDGAHIT